MFSLKSEKQPMSGVIADSFSVVKRSWLANLAIVIPFFIVIALLVMLVTHHSVKVIQQLAVEVQHSQVNPFQFLMAHGWIFVVSYFLFILLFMIMVGALIRAAWNKAQSGHAAIGQAYGVAFKKIPVYIAKMIIIFVMLGIVFGVMYLLSATHLLWLSSIVTCLLYLLFYYVIVKLILVEAAAVIDDHGMSSFGKSWHLTGGNWWRSVAVVVFASAIYMMLFLLVPMTITSAVVSPLNLPYSIAAAAGHPLQMVWAAWIVGGVYILTLIGLMLTWPTLFGATFGLLYHDLKLRHGSSVNMEM